MRKTWFVLALVVGLVIVAGAVLYAQNRDSGATERSQVRIYPDQWPGSYDTGTPVAITSAGRFLYVVKGDWLYKISPDRLYVYRRVWLGRPDMYRIQSDRGVGLGTNRWPQPEQFGSENEE